MADVAQSVRASGCGSEGRRFDSGHSPIFFAQKLLNINFQANLFRFFLL